MVPHNDDDRTVRGQALWSIVKYLRDRAVQGHTGPGTLALGVLAALDEGGLKVVQGWPSYHTLEFAGAHGYTLRHPLHCLADGVFLCEVLEQVELAAVDCRWENTVGKPAGRYVCDVFTDGTLWVADDPEERPASALVLDDEGGSLRSRRPRGGQ